MAEQVKVPEPTTHKLAVTMATDCLFKRSKCKPPIWYFFLLFTCSPLIFEQQRVCRQTFTFNKTKQSDDDVIVWYLDSWWLYSHTWVFTCSKKFQQSLQINFFWMVKFVTSSFRFDILLSIKFKKKNTKFR